MDPPIALFAFTFLVLNVVSNCYQTSQSQDVVSRVAQNHNVDDVDLNNLESRIGKLSKSYRGLLTNRGWNGNKNSKVVKVTYRRRTKNRKSNNPNVLYDYVQSHSVVGGTHRNVPFVHSNGINDLVTSVNSESSWINPSSRYYGGSTSQTVENRFGVPSYYGESTPERLDNVFRLPYNYGGSISGNIINDFNVPSYYGESKRKFDVNNFNSGLPPNFDYLQTGDTSGLNSDIFQVDGIRKWKPSNALRSKWADNTLDSKTLNPFNFMRSSEKVDEDVTSEDVTSENVTSEDKAADADDVTAEGVTAEDVTAEGITSEDDNVEREATEDVTSELNENLLKGTVYRNVHVVGKNNNPYWRTFRGETAEDVTGEDVTAEDVTSELNVNPLRRRVHKYGKLFGNNNKSYWRKFRGETVEDVTAEGVTAEDVTAERLTAEGVTAEDVTGEDVTAEDITTIGETAKIKKIYWPTVKGETAEDVTAEDVTSEGVTAEDVRSEDTSPWYKVTHKHRFSAYHPDSRTRIRNFEKMKHLPYYRSYKDLFKIFSKQICEKSKKLRKTKPNFTVVKKMKDILRQLNILNTFARDKHHINTDYDLPDDINQWTDIPYEPIDDNNWINPEDSIIDGNDYLLMQLIQDLKRLKPVNVDLDLQILYEKLIKYLQYYLINNNGNSGNDKPYLDSYLIPILTALRNQLQNPQKSQAPKITLKIKLLLSFLNEKYGDDSWKNIDENGDDVNYDTDSPDYDRNINNDQFDENQPTDVKIRLRTKTLRKILPLFQQNAITVENLQKLLAYFLKNPHLQLRRDCTAETYKKLLLASIKFLNYISSQKKEIAPYYDDSLLK